MSMYRQMNYSELVAYSTSEFIEKAHRLLTDSEYQRDQSEIIKNKFPLIRQNSLVAEEWLRFIARLF